MVRPSPRRTCIGPPNSCDCFPPIAVEDQNQGFRYPLARLCVSPPWFLHACANTRNGSVLASGIARVVSFTQVVNFTSHNTEAYFKDTPCEFIRQRYYILLVHQLTMTLQGYTGGPLFWVFAENAIAIIGACLPTLAPLWTQRSPTNSKTGSYLKRFRNKSTSNGYDDLEGPYRKPKHGEDTSDRQLVALAPATSIIADDIPLNERPREGIQVQTTLSMNNGW